MEIIIQGENFRVSWYDPEQSILLFEVLGLWKWDQTYEGIGKLNETIAATDSDIYTIYLFSNNVVALPKGSALPHIRYLMSQEYANERLIIFVGAHSILEPFLGVVGQIYGLRKIVAKYHFVRSLDAALSKIEDDRRSRR